LTTKFDGSASASIILKGNYYQQGGNDKKVLLELNYNEHLLEEMVKNSSSPISIDKNNPGTILLKFDPDVLFDNLNPSYWNSANNSNIGGSNGLHVANGANSNMYNQITPKIGESMTFSFEQ
jgi:hypothetical protein